MGSPGFKYFPSFEVVSERDYADGLVCIWLLDDELRTHPSLEDYTTEDAAPHDTSFGDCVANRASTSSSSSSSDDGDDSFRTPRKLWKIFEMVGSVDPFYFKIWRIGKAKSPVRLFCFILD